MASDSTVTTVENSLPYPLYLLPIRTLLDLSELPRHEELLEQKKLVQWRPTMRSVFYVSMEFSSEDHPDPGSKRLDVLKLLFTRMAQGRQANFETEFASKAASGKSLKISTIDWRELASNAHVWIGFCCAPTVSSASREAALRSFHAYISRATHFLALCPPETYRSHSGSNRTCDFRSWCDRGAVRVELSALLMAVTPKPAVLVKGDDSVSAIDVSRFTLSRPPGQGRFACCAGDHVFITNGGVSIPIPCQKPMARNVMMDLLAQRIEHHRNRCELDEMRLWKALMPRFLCGLGADAQIAPNTTPEAFLREFEFINDESDSSPAPQQSKCCVSPLFLAVMSGQKREVAQMLARTSPGDVTARLKSDFPALGLWAGAEPIHMAVAMCVGTNRTPLISLLLENGADPNTAAGKVGITPLYAGVAMHNREGVHSLITVAGDRLKIEKTNKINSDTALGGAAFLAPPEIVDVLLAAGANPAHVQDFGSTKMMIACQNPFATPDMLAKLGRATDVCHRRRTGTCFWALILRLFEIAVWLRVLTSHFAMDMAHMRGSTALHVASKHGHTSLVRWLLDHGAQQSLHVKNAMGCTPFDIANLFGPYPETSALLIQAMCDTIDFRVR
jgi:ankyrin repeat protein